MLPDGGHYERSPVYHLVVLRDLLEVQAAAAGVLSTSARLPVEIGFTIRLA